GGGISSVGQLTVTGTLFIGNVANTGLASAPRAANSTGYGGGIENFFGQLTGTGVALIGNTANAGSARTAAGGFALAAGYGGGIDGGNTITVNSSLVTRNIANSGTAAGEIDAGGGGIFDLSALTLSNTLVSANAANTGSGSVQLNATGGGISTDGG